MSSTERDFKKQNKQVPFSRKANVKWKILYKCCQRHYKMIQSKKCKQDDKRNQIINSEREARKLENN